MTAVRKRNKTRVYYCNFICGCRKPAVIWNICTDYPEDPNWDCTQYRVCKEHNLGLSRSLYDNRILVPTYQNGYRNIQWVRIKEKRDE